MIQQSHFWAYTPRKPELKETHVPQCSSQHCLQQPREENRQTEKDMCLCTRVCIYTQTYLNGILAIKKNEMPFAATRIGLESIILNEISQRETNI